MKTLFFVLILSSVSVQATSSLNNGDSNLLLKFKSSLPNPDVLSTWLPGKNICLFLGVSCHSNRVVSLDLGFVSLSSDFRHISYLMSLELVRTISVRSSNLNGSVASVSGVSCGSSLSDLDLSNNTLYGSVQDLVTFGACPGLKSLNMSRNELVFDANGSDLMLRSLQVIDLSYNKISGPNVVEWMFPNGAFGATRHLSLNGNRINGSFPIFDCGYLEHLDLSSNNFTSAFPNLTTCSGLKHVDLSANSFFGSIDGELSGCDQLEFLNLSSNHFSGRIPIIPAGNMHLLNLSGNYFASGIPGNLSKLCSSLTELDLSYNQLSGRIPDGFGSCSYLETINLSNNNLTGELPMDIILEMKNLKILILAYNNFVGPLSDSITRLPRLDSLDLSSNNLLGPIPGGLCENVKSTSLKELYLQNNMFVGPIPAALGNCSQLVSLDLSFNYLTGPIPPSLGTLSNLRDLILWLNNISGGIPNELRNLRVLESLILDFNQLTGFIPPGLSNCTNLSWISLSNNELSGEIPPSIGNLASLAILKLSNNSFYGRIPPELGDCQSLIWVDLNSNSFTGPVPPKLFKQSGKIAASLVTRKRYAYIKNEGGSEDCHGAGNLLEFAGIRQEQVKRISTRSPCNYSRVYGGITRPTFNHNGSMIFLDLSYNYLTGSIPKEIGSMFYLSVLNLGHNNLSGSIPGELGGLTSINILDLSYNKLVGSIPWSLTKLSQLLELDFSYNRLAGKIPESAQFGTFSNRTFFNNVGLCGYPLPRCDSVQDDDLNHPEKSHGQVSLAGSVGMGLLLSLFVIFGIIIVTVEAKKRRKSKELVSSTVEVYGDTHSGPANPSGWKLTGTREALSINLSTFEKPLQKLTFADLQDATKGFHDDSLIGSGGFGDVYRAQLKDGNTVAIKKLIHISGQGDREFTAEMETIGKIKHRNLVSLLGYCKVREERLLVYEYMRFGSLEDVLHDRRKAGIRLNWLARRKIAIGAARGLAFLHHNCIPHIIHRDMKSSNVLLDDALEARVSDFGMARLMSALDTHLSVSTLAGTPGYVPPEYYQSFRCSTKGDVYSYGVVLLELLTGKQPTDSVDFGDNNLVGWVKQHAKLKISDVFDPELMKEGPLVEIELLRHLNVASACLDERPWRRPNMIQVMALFKEIQTGTELDSGSALEDIDAIEMSIKEGS